MTTPPQPPVTPGPPEPYTLSNLMPAQPPPRQRRGWRPAVILAAIGGFTALAVGAFAIGATQRDDKPAGSQPAGAASSPSCNSYGVDAATGAVVCKAAGGAAVVNEQPQYAAPKPGDFTITVKVLRKKCFGSAGCNVDYRISPEYTGAPLDPGVTWLVTYEVRGVEDGPAVNTFEVTGDEASFDAEESASTTSSGAKLTAKATEVLRG